MKIGALELIVIFIVALLVIGPEKLPGYARRLGSALREFRKASADATQEIRESVIDPLEDAQKPLREAMEPLDELDRDLKAEIRSVENDLKDLRQPGRNKPQEPAADAGQPAAGEQTANPGPEVPAPAGAETTEGENI